MNARSWLGIVAVGMLAYVACAKGVGEADDDDQGGAGVGAAAGAGGEGAGTSSTTSTDSTSTDTGGAGVGAGGPQCDPPEHLCGTSCVGNTPNTGCYQSTTCDPCPTPGNGTSTCTGDGLCDIQCYPPYVRDGDQCVCGAECCSPTDCPFPWQECDGGDCACEQGLCIQFCAFQLKVGMCEPLFDNCLCVGPQ